MAKVFGKYKSNSDKKRISVRMPKAMIADIATILSKLNFNQKSRSGWVCRAITCFATQPNFTNMVQEEWLTPGANEPIQITLDNEAVKALEIMTETLKKDSENDHELHSSIVRTCIIQAILLAEKQLGEDK